MGVSDHIAHNDIAPQDDETQTPGEAMRNCTLPNGNQSPLDGAVAKNSLSTQMKSHVRGSPI